MKKSITLEVPHCNECPFENYSYDDFALGDAESHHCNLLKRDWNEELIRTGKLPHMEYFIFFYKNGNVKSKNKKTLNNCPLLSHDINVSIK